MDSDLKFVSGRSPVTCLNGCVASSQTLASQVGIDILKNGGNAADAAVATAAVLNVTEPCSTGLGGDMFCLYYEKKSATVYGLNASGSAPKHLTLEYLNKLGYNEHNGMPPRSVHCITVPGACAGWVSCFERFGSGSLRLRDVLASAISLAKDGFPVSGPVTSHEWAHGSEPLLDIDNKFGKELLIRDSTTGNFRAPKMGEIFRNPGLSQVLEAIGEKGKDGFYKGWVAKAIVNVVQEHGGVLELEDLEKFTASFVNPINIDYKGLRLWEIPPNGQGIVALEALNILKNFDLSQWEHNSVDYLHVLIEAIRLSFSDALQYCADVNHSEVPIEGLLNNEYGKKRSKLINNTKAMNICLSGDPPSCAGDTVYFTTADSEGNFCSFINSNFMGFGTGIVPEGCGFSLQNRGLNFSLKPGHPNVLAPGKRPYHTIIPAMVTDATSGELVLAYGVMGGFMQPQGHVQVLLNMVQFGMDPQQALDAPRFLVGSGHFGALGKVNLEEGISEAICDELRLREHDVNGPVCGFDRSMFGRGQIVARKKIWSSFTDTDVLWAGSDPRCDGIALGY